MLRNYLFFLLAASLVFSSCDDDDPKKDTDTPDGEIESQDDVDLVVTDLQGEVTGDITLAASKEWILTGPLVVNDGATLTIEAGTTIKAAAGGSNVYIAIDRGAKISAIGTAASPIKFTSNAASPASGNWGGLLLIGNAPITGGGSAVTEVVDFIYGGNVANDNSGTLKYVILEYTGALINDEKEFNGLTLYAVGTGTTIDNIFIKNGNDDSIEFFGGTVNVSNILAVNATDDLFDYTQGWVGTGTDLYGIREQGYDVLSSDPRGIEGDGNFDGLTPGLTPQSNPTLTNVTIVNKSTVAGGMNDVLKIRRNSAGSFSNVRVIFADNAPAPGDFVDCANGGGTGDAAASTTITISGTGANLNTADNNAGANSATITVGETTGVADPATKFAWTGYTF